MANIDSSKFVIHDGGLSNSKAKKLNPTKDCVVRALAIATGEPYDEILGKLKVANKALPYSKPIDLSRGIDGLAGKAVAKEYGWFLLWGNSLAGPLGAALRHFLLPHMDLVTIISPAQKPPFSFSSPHWVAIKSGRVHDIERFCSQGDPVLNIGVMAIFGKELADAAMIKNIAENASNLPNSKQAQGEVP